MTRFKRSTRRGAVAVETALVLPIIFAVFLGAVDFFRANMIRNTLDNAAFEAARFATIPGATEAEIKQVAQDTLDILAIENATVTVSPQVILDDTPSVTVQINVPLTANLYAASKILSGKTLSKTCTLTREQFAVEILE